MRTIVSCKTLLFIFIVSIFTSVHAAEVGFLGISMEQGFASYRKALEAKGYVFAAKVDENVVFQGTFNGFKKTQVMVVESSNKRSITDVGVMIPTSMKAGATQQLFNQYSNEFNRQYGSPKASEDGSAYYWEVGAYIVGVKIMNDNSLMLMYTRYGEEKKNDFIITKEAEQSIRDAFGRNQFLGISTELNLRDFCLALEEKDFIFREEKDNTVIYDGEIAGVGQTTIYVSALLDQQTIANCSLIFPAIPDQKQSLAFYEQIRSLLIAAHGEYSISEFENEPMTIWAKNNHVLILMLDEDHQVMILDMMAKGGETLEDIEKAAIKNEPTATYVQRMADAINDGRYIDAVEAAEHIHAVEAIQAVPYLDIDRTIAFLQWLRSAHYAQENNVTIRVARIMHMQSRQATERKEAIHARLWEEFTDYVYQFLLTKKHPWRKELEEEDSACFQAGAEAIERNPMAGLDFYRKVLEITKMLRGTRNRDYATNLGDMALAYEALGDYEHALQYCQEALALGDVYDLPIVYITLLRNIANLYRQAGMYAEAEEIFNQLQVQVDKLYDSRNTDQYISALHDLAIMALSLGDYKKADAYLDQELATLQKLHPEPYVSYAIAYLGKGAVYYQLKQYDKAIEYEKRALNNLVDGNPRHNKIYECKAYQSLSISYAESDPAQAVEYAQKAIDIATELYSKTNPDYATALSRLSYAYSKQGEYTKALSFDKKILSIYEQAVGTEHMNIAYILYNIGGDYSQTGVPDEAEQYYRRAISILKRNYQRALDYMSEHQRESYWDMTRQLMDDKYMANFIYSNSASRPSVSSFAYDNELFSKGLLLTSSNLVRRSIQESGDTTLIADYKELTRLKNAVMQLEQSGKAPEQLSVFRQQADSLEKTITKRSAAFRRNESLWNVDWKSVRNRLQAGQAAIEFTRLCLSEDTIQYAALLLRSDMEAPAFIPLFDEKELNTYADSIWQRMRPWLKEINTIYFAAVGGLHQLPIEYAPYDANSTWFDHYQLVRLSSTREIAMQHQEIPNSSAALFGGINYDLGVSELTAQSQQFSTKDQTATRSMLIDDHTLRAGVNYLPGTKQEVEEINSILRPQHIRTELFTSAGANEEAFKALSGQKMNIIHIATHGFYWSDKKAQRQRYFARQSSMDDNAPATKTIDPLNRSGLLFAGANIALRGHVDELPNHVQDGILTAKEISLMDLRNAQLVVLSACETGKGEVTGEGVFGLQRAFKMAGAQTILMTLWQVSDEATNLFMTTFFRYYTQGLPKREAFRRAQQDVRNYTEKENPGSNEIQPYSDPYFWAGFVLLD